MHAHIEILPVLCISQFQHCSSPPPLPQATAGHLLILSVQGVGQLQFYHGPGAGHLCTLGRPPGGIRHVFSKVPWTSSSMALLDVFKGILSQF